VKGLPRLWLCADVSLLPPPALLDAVERALSAGHCAVWLRSPQGHPGRALLTLAVALRSATARAGSVLLVGDRLDVALAAEADGVHLAGRSVRPRDARRLSPGAMLVSCAAHDAEELRDAATSADAVVLSPFRRVEGKGPPLGADGFSALRALAPGAFAVALGGIASAADARDAIAAGADAIAVRRLLCEPDVAARCAALRRALP
jgi:thiamine-phosphate pyrophosphorylase